MEELDAVGVATVLTADAHFQGGVGFPAVHYRHVDELPDAVAVDRLEGVDGKYLDFPICAWLLKTIDVFEQELALGVVAAEAKGGLRQVVGAEAEELGHLGDRPGGQSCAGQFDHSAEFVGDALAGLASNFFGFCL